MSNAPTNHDTSLQDIERNDVLNAIAGKWGKFSEEELSALNTNDELVGQLMKKYGMDKIAAQRDVTALLAGRNL